MHNITFQKRLYLLQGIIGWKQINIKSAKKAPKGEILPILSCFLFLFDESMIKFRHPRKTIQGQKYIKLADIATLNIVNTLLCCLAYKTETGTLLSSCIFGCRGNKF